MVVVYLPLNLFFLFINLLASLALIRMSIKKKKKYLTPVYKVRSMIFLE